MCFSRSGDAGCGLGMGYRGLLMGNLLECGVAYIYTDSTTRGFEKLSRHAACISCKGHAVFFSVCLQCPRQIVSSLT